ncbi:MAG: two component regulator propeller domain protein [Bacteroidetes bacterium]|nr:two component regulator propeller domain protein [Bacteroidota bacterium]
MRTKSICLGLVIVLLYPTASAQWMQTNGPYGGRIQSLAMNGTNLFAGTCGGGVFSSTNDGKSWTATGLTSRWVFALTVSKANLFAGTSGGVFLSTNNGTCWTPAHSGLTDTTVSCLAVSGTNLFAGTSTGGVFLSTNSGTSWTAVSEGLPKAAWDSTLYAPIYCFGICGLNLFAGTWGGGVFRSTNNGTSWTPVSNGLTSTIVLALAVSP